MHLETINPITIAYSEHHTSPEGPILADLSRHTFANVMQPRMLSGHIQGRFLAMISQLMQPKRILEIGTYVGYSALCLAEGLRPDGVIHTIDINEELEHIMRKYWAAAGKQDQIRFHYGPAAEIIPHLHDTEPNEHWDLVFIDADKPSYGLYYDLVIDHVRPGGIILSDNVLWNGKVAEPQNHPKDRDLPHILTYNQKLLDDPRTENILLPIRDGIMVSRKL